MEFSLPVRILKLLPIGPYNFTESISVVSREICKNQKSRFSAIADYILSVFSTSCACQC